MSMMKDSPDRNTKTRITIIAMIPFLLRHWGLIRRFAIRTGRNIAPSNLFNMGNTIIISWECFEDCDNIHDLISFLPYLGILNQKQKCLSRVFCYLKVGHSVNKYSTQNAKSSEFENLNEKLKKREISIGEFHAKTGEIQDKFAISKLNKYYTDVVAINRERKAGTVWEFVRKVIFIVMVLCLVYLGYGYFRNMKADFRNNNQKIKST